MTHNGILKKLQNRCPDCGLELDAYNERANFHYGKLYDYSRICTWKENKSTLQINTLFHLNKGNHILESHHTMRLFEKFSKIKSRAVIKKIFTERTNPSVGIQIVILHCNRCSWFKSIAVGLNQFNFQKSTNKLLLLRQIDMHS